MNTIKNSTKQLKAIENLLIAKGAKTRMKKEHLLFNYKNTPGKVRISDGNWLINHEKLSARGEVNDILAAIERETSLLNVEVLLEKLIQGFGEEAAKVSEDKYEMGIKGVKITLLVREDSISVQIGDDKIRIYTKATDEDLKTFIENRLKKVDQYLEYYENCQEKIKVFKALLKKHGVGAEPAPKEARTKEMFDKIYQQVDVNSICFYFKYREIEMIAETDIWNSGLIRLYKLEDVAREDLFGITISRYCHNEEDYQQLFDELEYNYEKLLYGSKALILSAVDALVEEGHTIHVNKKSEEITLFYKDFFMVFSYGECGIYLKSIRHAHQDVNDGIAQRNSKHSRMFIGDHKIEVEKEIFSNGTTLVPNKLSGYNYLLKHIQYIDTILEMLELVKNAKGKFHKLVLANHFGGISLRVKFDYEDVSKGTDNVISVCVSRSFNKQEWGVDRKCRYSQDYSFPTGDRCANVSEAKKILAEHENDIQEGF